MTWPAAAAAIVIAVAIAGSTYGAIAALLPWLIARGVVDTPNDRSSHHTPRPRGAGLAIVAILVPVWLAWVVVSGAPLALTAVPAAAAALAWVSWRDDLAGLGQWPRLAAHVAAAAVLTWSLPGPVFQGWLPPVPDAVATALLLVWFINLYNFMDGIDGITGVETVTIGGGLALVFVLGGSAGLAWPALAVAAAAAGFLAWNWAPARVFMGDVGAIPLGAMTGWLLLFAATQGYWAAALILPAYYLADATITLLRRAIRGANLMQAHREHFYQRAVSSGRGHATVARTIAGANLALVVHAAALTRLPSAAAGFAVASAAFVVTGLLIWLARPPPNH